MLRKLLLLVACASCSIGVRGPQGSGTAEAPPPCTRSYARPALDAAATVGLLILAYAAASFPGLDCGDEGCNDKFEPGVFAVGAVVAAPFVISAGVGVQRIGRCEQAQRHWTTRQAGQRDQRRAAELVATRDPAAWAAARDGNRLGQEDQWCKTTSASVVNGSCERGLVCDAGTCRRRCHETSPGAEMWTCGPGYRCSADRAGCIALPTP